MTVLVTRGWPGAERTAAGLRRMGINPIVSPVLDINFRARIDVDLADTQALVFTSANGVEHFFDYFFKAFCDVRALWSTTWSCTGLITRGASLKSKTVSTKSV